MSKELEGLTVALAIPTYGPVDPYASKTVRSAMMHASNRGVRWAGDMSTDKVGWGAARNMSAQALLDLGGEADGMLWIDSDIIPQPDSITRLLVSARDYNADVMAGVYHKKAFPFTPVIYHYDPSLEKFFELDDYIPDLVITPGGCGFGFVYTSYSIIKRIAEAPDFEPTRGGWFPDQRYNLEGKGEDMNFCLKVQRLGVPVYVDTGVQVGHQGGSIVSTRADFLKACADIKAGIKSDIKPPKWGIE